MAKNIQKLAQSRPEYREKVFVVHDKIENSNADRPVQIPPVDTIVSEPIGVLLVHERMLESYLYARDNFLKPGYSLLFILIRQWRHGPVFRHYIPCPL